VFPKSFPGEKSNQFFRVRVVKWPPNLPRRVHDVERPLVSPYETTSAISLVESAWGLLEGEEGEKAKAVSRCDESLCRGKESRKWSRKKPPRRDFLSPRCFDVAGAGMSIGFDLVKKVETDEEDEGVSYSWEDDERSAGVHDKAHDCFSWIGETRCSWVKKSNAGSNVKAPVFKLADSSNTRENSASFSLATDMGREAW